MSVEKNICAFLLQQTALTKLIGARIFPIHIPQNSELPAIAYNMISKPRTYSQSGDSHLVKPRIQFSCFGHRYHDVRDVADQIVIALSGFKGNMDGATIQSAFIENEVDLYESDTKIYHIPVDVIFQYNDN